MKECLRYTQIFDSKYSHSDDPKQNMSAMPRTSMGKIFTTLSADQQAQVLKQAGEIKQTHSIADSNKIVFEDYREYLTKLYEKTEGVTTTQDPIANHSEPLGIGKLKDTMESDLSGKNEFPIFEFRRIGGYSLKALPEFLGEVNDFIVEKLS